MVNSLLAGLLEWRYCVTSSHSPPLPCAFQCTYIRMYVCMYVRPKASPSVGEAAVRKNIGWNKFCRNVFVDYKTVCGVCTYVRYGR